MNTLIFIAVAVCTYYLLSIVQAVLHREFGHRKRIRAVFRGHAIGHHGVYNRRNLRTEAFIHLESSAAGYYGIPIALIGVLVFVAGGTLVLAAHLAGAFVTIYLHVVLHRHYHLNETPLERFAWFREKRRLHFIHHFDARYNFAVVEFWVDDLLSTKKNRLRD
jgi:sterol desaturase/sphingolipid hydroxylase (fatty acid hydroxylase superfamily)